MIFKSKLKEKAVELRKEGKVYSEILKEVPVAKSTLSLWLRDVGLAKAQKQRLTQKKLDASKRGGQAKHEQRVKLQQDIFAQAHKDITHISKRELWLIGIALYWAEGSKEKEHNVGSPLQIGNSDPRMIKVFLKWLLEIMKVTRDQIVFRIYIHENSKNDVNMVKRYWSEVTGFPLEKFINFHFKKHKIKTNRKNIGREYYGGLRIDVKTSSTLLRKVTGWTEAIVKQLE
ncbi:MAG: hypothetical protein RL292_535 [Candidatus Parcubacteria bacterium]|jgi:hypothetical protein